MSVPLTDLVVYDAHGQIAGLVEVKKRTGTTTQWATEFRRNILAHGGYPAVRFFLLVTPDRVYVWLNSAANPELVPPDIALPAEPLLRPYFQSIRRSPDDVGREGFESVVGAWLSDLTWPETAHKRDRRAGELGRAGFVDAVTGGRVEYGLAA